METKTASQGKVIGNVGTLDLRNATEESVAGIGRIGNVGMLLYNRETARFIAQLNAGNVGASLEVPGDARLLSGVVTFTPSFFKGQGAPQSYVVAGQLVVEPDVAAEDIEAGLELASSGRAAHLPRASDGSTTKQAALITGPDHHLPTGKPAPDGQACPGRGPVTRA